MNLTSAACVMMCLQLGSGDVGICVSTNVESPFSSSGGLVSRLFVIG